MAQYPFNITLLVLGIIIFITGCKDNPIQTDQTEDAEYSTVSIAGYVQYMTSSGVIHSVENAMVTIDQSDDFLISDSVGYFNFDHVRTGSQTFRISHADFLEFSLTTDIKPQINDTLFITLTLAHPLYSIEGNVNDARTPNTPIPNVKVILPDNRYTYTNAMGDFSLSGIRAGETELTLLKTNFDTVFVNVDISGQTEKLYVTLMPTLIEYFPLSIGYYWLFSHSATFHHDFVEEGTEEGTFSWEVVDITESGDQIIYHVEEVRFGEAVWNFYDGRTEYHDLGYKKLFNVTGEGHEWVFRDQNGNVHQRRIRAFPADSPDEIETMIRFGSGHWGGNETFLYKKGTGILRWTYFSTGRGERTTVTRELIEYITN